MNIIVFSIIVLTITIIGIILSFIIGFYTNKNVKKSSNYNNCLSNLKISNQDDYIVSELFAGNIKCNLITNTSAPYNAKKWTKKINKFINKPIFKQLMSLEGK